MADNLKKQPKKGILKNSTSFEQEERQKAELSKGTKWDEMNILATLHPKDKDYGHMKVDEPKTPYEYATEDSGDEIDGIDADLLAQKIEISGGEMPKALHESEEESSEEEEETPEEKAKRKLFEMKRKHHYNEFAAVKLARKLMEEDEEVDEEVKDKDNVVESGSSEPANQSTGTSKSDSG